MKIRFRLIALLSVFAFGCAPAGIHSIAPAPVRTSVGINKAAPDEPNLKRLKNGHYRVRQPWTVKINGREWHVEQGYSSNGITAPAAIRKNLGDGVQHPETWAAVFHDWLFTQPGMTRKLADRTFYDLLIAYGVPVEKADLMYSSVRLYSMTKKAP